MRRVQLIGSEGFIGKSIQRVATSSDGIECWSHRRLVEGQHFDILDPSSWNSLLRTKPSHVILLSWPGLPDYNGSFHLRRNLPACVEFIEKLIEAGVRRVVVSGTCYEYGLVQGSLSEDHPTDPVNIYGIAKDSFRRTLKAVCEAKDVQWCWARIFYPYGEGQNANSLLPSLRRAIENGEPEFMMGSGEIARDFICVDTIAKMLIKLGSHPAAHGIYNCGSGKPTTTRELAERVIRESSSEIRLRFGSLANRQDEPFSFWADTKRISELK